MNTITAHMAIRKAFEFTDHYKGDYFPGIKDHEIYMWHPKKMIGCVNYGWFGQHLQPSEDAPENLSAKCE